MVFNLYILIILAVNLLFFSACGTKHMAQSDFLAGSQNAKEIDKDLTAPKQLFSEEISKIKEAKLIIQQQKKPNPDQLLKESVELNNIYLTRYAIKNGANLKVFDYHKEGDPEYDDDRSGYKPLQEAVRAGHIEIVRELLDSGVDINDQSDFWRLSALIIAARADNLAMVQFLLRYKPEVNLEAGDDMGSYTALHEAVENGNLKILKTLVDAGAKVDDPNFLVSPLSIAAKNGHLGAVKFLLKNGAAPSDGLLDAAIKGHTEIVKFLIENGARIAVKSWENYKSRIKSEEIKSLIMTAFKEPKQD